MHGTGTEEGDSALQRIFGGLLQSDVMCCACGHTSTAHDPFLDISLDIKPPPLNPAPLLRPPGPAHKCALAPAPDLSFEVSVTLFSEISAGYL